MQSLRYKDKQRLCYFQCFLFLFKIALQSKRFFSVFVISSLKSKTNSYVLCDFFNSTCGQLVIDRIEYRLFANVASPNYQLAALCRVVNW